MKTLGLGVIGGVLATVLLVSAAERNQEAMRLLKAARNVETVDGNLRSAVGQYKRIVDVYGKTDRATAAEALVRMAECYQKLGDAEWRRSYERVVREYADQKEFATLAQSRLNSSEPARITSRRVATIGVGGVGYGSVSPDGRYFPYTDWDNGDLYVRDLVGGSTRPLTNESGMSFSPSHFAAQAVFAKDGRQVAYAWLEGRSAEIRIVDAAGPGISQPRRIYRNEDIAQIWPDDWSADGKWLAVQIRRQDKTAQIGLLNAQDGSLHVLKSVDWRGATRLVFSPDGKHLAYDLPVSDKETQRDLFVLAIEGRREASVPHPADDVVMGWAPDASAVLFSSDRSGTVGLWQVRVADGKPHAVPDLLRPQVQGTTLGIIRSGTLYTLVHPPSFNAVVSADVQVATFDFRTGHFLSAPTTAVQRFVGTNSFPVWSPNGKRLAYVSRRSGATVIGIRSETGDVRELRPALNSYPPAVRWSADGRSLLTHATDVKGRQGLFRIDVETEAVVPIVLSTDDAGFRWPEESRDGKRIYYIRGYVSQPAREFAVVERVLGTGNERDVVRGRGIVAIGPAPMLSPDGHWLIVYVDDPAAKSSALVRVGVRDGERQELIRVESPRRSGVHGWTPDGSAILVSIAERFQVAGVTAPGMATELWRVPLDGSPRQKLDVNVAGMTPFSVHPDGRQIAFGQTAPKKDDEIWVLENFLPAPASSKTLQSRPR